MTEYETRTLSVIVAPMNEPIFSERATTIRIEDDSGGEFLVIEQSHEGYGKIAINPEEWPALREAIERMLKECRE